MTAIGPIESPLWVPYSRAILKSPGLISYWPMREPSGVVGVDAKGGNTGAWTAGTVLGATGPIASEVASAATLVAASSQYLNIPSNASLNVGAVFSLAIWIKRTTAGQQVIMSKGDGAFELWFDTTNYLYLTNQATAHIVRTAAITDTASWHFLVATLNTGSSAAIYVDGLDASIQVGASTPISTSYPLTIGMRNPNNDLFLNAKICEAALWGRAINPGEVAYFYATARA